VSCGFRRLVVFATKFRKSHKNRGLGGIPVAARLPCPVEYRGL
jgi:hypothetical protein